MSESVRWQEQFDIVIVGSGAGSMVAALKARQLGLSCVILEKLSVVGGSTGYSGGVMWVPCNPLMQRDGSTDSLAQARTYIDATVRERGLGASDERIEAYLRTGPDMVDFLEREGFAFRRPDGYPDYYTTAPGAMREPRSLIAALFDASRLGAWREKLSVYGVSVPLGIDELTHLLMMKRTWKGRRMAATLLWRLLADKLTGRHHVGAGAALQGRLLELALRNGIDIRTGAAVVRLVDAAGRVVGVDVRIDGKSALIGARNGVLLNAGGFSHNAAMRQRYGRQPATHLWSSANPGDTGEMIADAQRLGAAVECMDEAIWSMISLGPDASLPPGAERPGALPLHFAHHLDISCPHSIVVDQLGRRFANEAGSYMEMGQRLYRRHAETGKGIPAWAIIDSRHRAHYAWGRCFGATPRTWLDSGYMITANSVAELAARCGIDAAGLQDEITRFNGFAATGRDADFGRGEAAFDRFHGDPTYRRNPNLGSIDKPPFHAVRIYPGDVGTAGGVVADADARVLRADGSVIAGLYAAGNSAAPVFGRSYIGAGTSIASSMIFAYRAVIDAASRA